MPGNPAVGINQNLTTGETGIGYRPANDKPTGSINIVFGLIVYKRSGDNCLDYLLNDVLLDFIMADLRIMRVSLVVE